MSEWTLHHNDRRRDGGCDFHGAEVESKVVTRIHCSFWPPESSTDERK